MTFLDRLQMSFAQLGTLLPALVGALVILFAGYLLARLVQRGTERALRRIRLNQLLERGGVMDAVERSGSHMNPTRAVSNLLFWFIMFAVLLLAATALGLDSLADVFSQLVSYIPSVIAAVVVVIVGIVLGEFVGGLIMASAGSLHGGPTLARVGRGGVVMIAVFMALQLLGVAPNIVTTAFAILFGSAAFAIAIAFGLGNRDLAGEVTREWYERYRAERLAIEREVAQQDAAELADEAAEERLAEERAAGEPRAEGEARRRRRTADVPIPTVTDAPAPQGAAPHPSSEPDATRGGPELGAGTPADRRS